MLGQNSEYRRALHGLAKATPRGFRNQTSNLRNITRFAKKACHLGKRFAWAPSDLPSAIPILDSPIFSAVDMISKDVSVVSRNVAR